MTTKEKIKAFIEENAKHKTGQVVYWIDNDKKLRCARVRYISIDSQHGCVSYYGDSGYIGNETFLFGSPNEVYNARCAEVADELNTLITRIGDDRHLTRNNENDGGDE